MSMNQINVNPIFTSSKSVHDEDEHLYSS